jgi:thiopurine S-methyltransferase
MAHPDHALWKKSWRSNQIPFHLSHVHPMLVRFWEALGLVGNERVFIPLCGKSLDVMWLHQHGHPVVGVELSPVAVSALFKAAQLSPKRKNQGELVRWTQDGLKIFSGDFFALTEEHLLGVQAVYDRAALTALPENLREYYVAHLHAILPTDCQILLLTVEDLDDDENAADSMVQSEEIISLYSVYFSIELLHAEYHQANPEAVGQPLDTRCIHKAYRLRRANPAFP